MGRLGDLRQEDCTYDFFSIAITCIQEKIASTINEISEDERDGAWLKGYNSITYMRVEQYDDGTVLRAICPTYRSALLVKELFDVLKANFASGQYEPNGRYREIVGEGETPVVFVVRWKANPMNNLGDVSRADMRKVLEGINIKERLYVGEERSACTAG